MKHYFLLLILVCTASFAQNKTIFGINLGGTYANIRGNEVANRNNYDLNFLVGGSIEIALNEKFSFLGNINYERKTFKNTIEKSDFEGFDPIIDLELVDVKLRLEYITIPLNLKYYFGTSKRFFINGAPYVGVFLDSQSKTEGKKSGSDENFLFKTFDFGANFGVGSRFEISDKYRLNLEIRHNYGLSNISDVQVVNGGSVKTNAFNLIANWQFN
jgi:hypothetical protein